MLNNISLQGRITRDLEMKVSNSGKEILKFSIAVQRTFKNAQGGYDADFINCIAFGKTATFINQYSGKGKLITITGRIQTGSYENTQGQKVYTTDIMVNDCDVFTGNDKTENTNSPYNINTQDISTDDLPF